MGQRRRRHPRAGRHRQHPHVVERLPDRRQPAGLRDGGLRDGAGVVRAIGTRATGPPATRSSSSAGSRSWRRSSVGRCWSGWSTPAGSPRRRLPLVAVAFLVLRRREPAMERPFRVPGGTPSAWSPSVLTPRARARCSCPGMPAALIWPYEWLILGRWSVAACAGAPAALVGPAPQAEQSSPPLVRAAAPLLYQRSHRRGRPALGGSAWREHPDGVTPDGIGTGADKRAVQAAQLQRAALVGVDETGRVAPYRSTNLAQPVCGYLDTRRRPRCRRPAGPGGGCPPTGRG